MSWVTFAWSMAAGISTTLSLVHLLVWLRNREAISNLLFSASAASAAAIAILELFLMRSASAAEFAAYLRWMHLPAAILTITVVWFIRHYLGTGRAWLAWLITGLRTLILLLNFVELPNATFQEVTSLREVYFLGEALSAPVGSANPWRILIHLSSLLLLIYTVDAAYAAFRHGKKRQALVIGASVPVAICLAATFSGLMVGGILPGPLIALVYLILVLPMAFELSVDLTRAKQLSDHLQESQERIHMAAQAAKLGFWDWDIDKDVVWLDVTGERLIGTTHPDSTSRAGYMSLICPEDRGKVRRALDEALERNVEFRVEFRMGGSDGCERWISALGQVQRSAEGRPVSLRGISMDITHLKGSEAELQKHRNALARTQRIFSMGQLSAVLAHELNQPLGAILRNAEAGETILRMSNPDLAELRDILNDIQSDDRRAAEVIERMSALLRHRGLSQEVVSAHRLVQSVVELLGAEAEARNVALEVAVDPDLPELFADKVQLQQILLNLLLNSMDALDSTQGRARKIEISAHAKDGWVEIAVRDNGSGIADERFPDLFEPFVTTKQGGTGIGLAISQTIIKAHHGRIWAENNPEGGACFRFSLPAAHSVTPA